QQPHEIRLARRKPEARDETIVVAALLGEADRLLVRAPFRRELEMADALADAMPSLGSAAFGFGEAAVDVRDTAREARDAGHAAFEPATAVGERRVAAAQRPDVGDVVDNDDG